jgi:hypothetical protein
MDPPLPRSGCVPTVHSPRHSALRNRTNSNPLLSRGAIAPGETIFSQTGGGQAGRETYMTWFREGQRARAAAVRGPVPSRTPRPHQPATRPSTALSSRRVGRARPCPRRCSPTLTDPPSCTDATRRSPRQRLPLPSPVQRVSPPRPHGTATENQRLAIFAIGDRKAAECAFVTSRVPHQ